MKQPDIFFDGTVIDVVRDFFKVKLDHGQEVLAYGCGRMRSNKIKIVEGDRVKVAVSPYDLNRGRIVYRYRD